MIYLGRFKTNFFFSYIISEAYSREQTLIAQNIVGEHNGSDFVFVEDPEAKEELWKVSGIFVSC